MEKRRRSFTDISLSITIGVVYLWFGSLKFFSGVSPAEELAQNTIDLLTFGLIPSNVSIILLAIWETAVGILLITNQFKKYALYAALVHMICTFTPLFLFPELSFTASMVELTLVGQYIIKNLIIIAALMILMKEK
ncbi:MAG: doxx family protein [Cyclobacteriaceae bacterium]|nr:doxx family protein [Cyclobacteriaceae bacterium]